MTLIITNIPHWITFVLWFLLIPGAVLMIVSAPVQQRLALPLGFARLLVLSSVIFYLWNMVLGGNESMVNVLLAGYMALEATTHVLITEYWLLMHKQNVSPKTPAGQAPDPNAGGKVIPAPSRSQRKKQLAWTISLLVMYWVWLIFSLTQLHLR